MYFILTETSKAEPHVASELAGSFFPPAVIGVDALQQPLCAFTLHHSTLVSGESDVPV